jgi:C1A family cysteine protease
MTPRKIEKYGWIPSLPDPRDIKYMAAAPIKLLPALDLRAKCPPVYDQLKTGSCTGNSWGGAFEYMLMYMGLGNWTPSRLFIYYCERAFNQNTGRDSGAMLRDGAKALANFGTCKETTWAFDENMVTTQPTNASYVEALNYKIKEYQSIPNDINTLKQCISEELPFVFGFTVFSSFESDDVANTGIMPMPDTRTESVVGGHAVMGVGYDDSKNAFIIRNSWGADWGDGGYFYMPYDYISSSLASDFWCIKSI